MRVVKDAAAFRTNVKNQLTKLFDGLEITYRWIYNQITSGENTKKFTRGY